MAVVSATTGPAFGDDILLKDLPDAVRKTVEQETRGAKLEDIDREHRPDGSIYYEVELERDNQEWKLNIDESGKVIERRRDT